MRFAISLALVLSMLLLGFSACDGGAASPVGKWTLDTQALSKNMMAKQMANVPADKQKEMANDPRIKGMLAMFEKMKMDIVILADGTCTGAMSMMGKDEKSTGTWKLDGDVIAIAMKTTGKKDAKSETMKFSFKGEKMVGIPDEKQKKAQMPAFTLKRVK